MNHTLDRAQVSYSVAHARCQDQHLNNKSETIWGIVGRSGPFSNRDRCLPLADADVRGVQSEWSFESFEIWNEIPRIFFFFFKATPVVGKKNLVWKALSIQVTYIYIWSNSLYEG